MTVNEIINKKAELIALKRLQVKHSNGVLNNLPLENKVSTKMKPNPNCKDGGELECLTVKVVGNTYYWLDSHGDVHVDGCFTKSIKENANKIYHLDNHKHSFSDIVGKVEMIEEIQVKWQDLGVDKQGKTTCLVMTSEIEEDYNCKVFEAYKENKINQHSVGMQYIKMDLAVNSNDINAKEEKATWDKYYSMLGNPEKADEEGYFWVVKEAKLLEISALLWDGSNSLTPTINIEIEPLDNTQNKDKNEPSIDTQKQFFINLLTK
jgi:hypothetical protein